MATDLNRERIIRQAMALLKAMGAQGEGYDHHERAFRDLETVEGVVQGAHRVIDYANTMITPDVNGHWTLTGKLRHESGLQKARDDGRCRDLAGAIRDARDVLRLTLQRMGMSGRRPLALGRLGGYGMLKAASPLGPWARQHARDAPTLPTDPDEAGKVVVLQRGPNRWHTALVWRPQHMYDWLQWVTSGWTLTCSREGDLLLHGGDVVATHQLESDQLDNRSHRAMAWAAVYILDATDPNLLLAEEYDEACSCHINQPCGWHSGGAAEAAREQDDENAVIAAGQVD